MQNILAFRFANGMFEPLWNKQHIDHIQFSVAESVSVEGRGGYYDRSGVLRDMIQNHMLQMLAYVAMEPPVSFEADDIRDEKAKVLRAVRVWTPEEALKNTVRGQYGPGKKADGSDVPRLSPGKPTLIRSRTPKPSPRCACSSTIGAGKACRFICARAKRCGSAAPRSSCKFKKAPAVLFRGTPVTKLSANRLIFHIQPDQAIETFFQAKTPGPVMQLQPVNMRFNYGEAFRAARGTGYEVMIYSCMMGDPTLFSRTDLVETAWRIAQPLLDAWAATPAAEFPNYPAGIVGPVGGPRLDRARRPALVRGDQPRNAGARAAVPRRRSAVSEPGGHCTSPTGRVGRRSDHSQRGRRDRRCF